MEVEVPDGTSVADACMFGLKEAGIPCNIAINEYMLYYRELLPLSVKDYQVLVQQPTPAGICCTRKKDKMHGQVKYVTIIVVVITL